jgi:hypothetical protein
MYFRLLISKCNPQLKQAVPGSSVFFPGFFALGGIHFSLGGVLFPPVACPCRRELYGLLGGVARELNFQPQTIQISF